MLDALLRYCPAARSKTVVNRYGVSPSSVRKVANRPCRGSGSTVTLLYTSLYAEHKNFGTLLRALLQLLKNKVDCRLITPADPDWQGPRQSDAWRHDSQTARDPELRHRLEFTGVLGRDAIAKLYASADVFVYPSVVESFGHPLLEAMAAGLPVVAADAPVNRELCANAAVFFSPYDATDCARQIQRVIEDPTLASELARRGMERSHSFQWAEHGFRLLAALANSESTGPLTSSARK
jgi:glycosyltransferase involved in cell wall biosynthesis